MSKRHRKQPIAKKQKQKFLTVDNYQIWNKLINHASSNQVNYKIDEINVNRDVLTYTHYLTVKIILNKHL
jgi:hypothetical protein